VITHNICSSLKGCEKNGIAKRKGRKNAYIRKMSTGEKAMSGDGEWWWQNVFFLSGRKEDKTRKVREWREKRHRVPYHRQIVYIKNEGIRKELAT
jgi:hypothetical protein